MESKMSSFPVITVEQSDKAFCQPFGVRNFRTVRVIEKNVNFVVHPEKILLFTIAPEALYERSWTGPMIFSIACTTFL